MDGDLWDWSYDQGFSFSEADEGSSYGVETGWQADFYFGYGRDVIEEHAMNEKCCVQVLKILIQKAAAEIEDLEGDLVMLQCDLAWTDSRNNFEACCNALRKKIDILHNSIKSLRQSDKINTDDLLPVPPEELYEILKPFLGEQDDGQEQHATMNSQSTDTPLKLASPFCETSSIAGIEVRSEGMEAESILLAVDTIPNGSALKHKENDSICDKEIKPEIAVDGVCSNLLVTEENDCLKPDNLKSVSIVKIEEAKEQRINNTTCKSRELMPASNVVGDRCFLKAQKHGKSVSEKANPEVSRQSDRFSGNKRVFDSNSSSPAHSNSGNCNTEEKLIDFLIRKKNKSDVRPIIPESNGRSASSCLSSITNGRVNSDLQVLETQKPCTFDTSYFRIMLLRKLQDQQGNDVVRTQTKGTEKLLLEDSPNFENVTHEKSHLNVSSMLKAFTENGENGRSNTSISKAKKQRKQGAIGDNACLDLPLEPKPRGKSVEPCQLKAEMQDGALGAEKNLCPVSQNKGTSKMMVGQEFIDLSFVDGSDQIKLDNGIGEDKQLVRSCATTDDHDIAEIFALLTSPDHKQKDLSLKELRIMAKHFNFTKYHKLRKQVLLNMLVRHLESEGRQTNGEVMCHH